jgi:DedD protein
MAFFNFRKTGADSDAIATQPESIEALRKRAKQRLIGASILVLVGVIGFPLVFDTQPRPIPVDIPIDIPDRGKTGTTNTAVGAVSPATAPASAPAPAAPAAEAPVFVPPVAEPTAPAKPAAPAAAVVASAPAPTPAPAAAVKPSAPAPAAAPAKASAPAPNDGDRARALLEGKPASAAAAEGRFVVQVGAFADAARAREARQTLEKAGLKTYTQVVDTKEGKRIRVRVGPFESRAEADKAAAKVKGLDLPASVLTL